jgi:sugar transferase (PEP-CTERM/EpsH1 system associated)
MNVLVLTQRLPYAPNRGDRIRAYHLLREMSRFATVSLFSLVHDDHEAGQVTKVPVEGDVATARVARVRNAVRGVLSLPTSRPLTHSLLNASDATQRLEELIRRRRPDVVLTYCSSMTRWGMEPPLDRFPLVIDMVDVDSVKWSDYARETAVPMRWIYAREAATLRRFEAIAARRARATLVVAERERQELLKIAPGTNVITVPIGIDVPAFAPPSPPGTAPQVVFCGVMDYLPNVRGIAWFAREVWPHVLRQRPDAQLVVVGANPAAEVQALAKRNPTIEVTGTVPAVTPYLWSAAVAIAPLHVSRGVQTKVLEAIAAGLPVVATPGVGEGLPDAVRAACELASSADEFASAVLRLLEMSPEQRRQRASLANLDRLTWAHCLAPIERILIGAAGEPRPTGT